MKKKYIILKGRIRSEYQNFYSIFILIIDRELKILESNDVLATRIPTFYHNSVAQTWEDVRNEILKQLIEGNNIINLSRLISQTIEKTFLNEDTAYLIKLIEQNMDKFIGILEDNINRALLKGDVKIEITKYESDTLETEKKTEENVSEELSKIEEKEEIEQIKFKVPEGVKVIPVKPVLAPVSGTPIYELSQGDVIFVNIDTDFSKAKEYIEYFNAMEGDKVVPIKGEILEILIDMNNNYLILVKLDDAIYGQIVEEEKIKIKKYIELDETEESTASPFSFIKKTKNKKDRKKKGSTSSIIIYLTLAIAILFIIIFIIMLFL